MHVCVSFREINSCFSYDLLVSGALVDCDRDRLLSKGARSDVGRRRVPNGKKTGMAAAFEGTETSSGEEQIAFGCYS